jgi:type III secretion system YscQ/HrcQ family protein
MTGKKDSEHDDTQIEDLEVFEEWEAGEEAAPQEVSPQDEFSEADVSMSDDLSYSELEMPQQEEASKSVPERAERPAPPVAAPQAEEDFSDALLELAPDVPANLVAVIGKKTTSVGELMKMKIGHVIDLGRPPGETVDLVVNGRLIARGELVDIDGQLGVRILKMVK